MQHDWMKSPLAHGEQMCRRCFGTSRELVVLGQLDNCDAAPEVEDKGTSRITVERILRDADDASGQTIRDWKIEAERGHITLRLRHGDGFLILRPDDMSIFINDLRRAEATARALA